MFSAFLLLNCWAHWGRSLESITHAKPITGSHKFSLVINVAPLANLVLSCATLTLPEAPCDLFSLTTSPAFPHFQIYSRDSLTLAGAALPLWSCSPPSVTSFLSVLFSPALQSPEFICHSLLTALRPLGLSFAPESPSSTSATCTRNSSHYLKIKQPDSLYACTWPYCPLLLSSHLSPVPVRMCGPYLRTISSSAAAFFLWP